jgi:hypothetical protein
VPEVSQDPPLGIPMILQVDILQLRDWDWIHDNPMV